MADYKWEVGTIFSGKEDFKDAIRRYVVHAGRDLKFVKNDNRRVRVRCMGAQGYYKGELLTAVGRDPNDQMLPLAYAVVEVENKDSWTWFLQLLIQDLGGSQVCGVGPNYLGASAWGRTKILSQAPAWEREMLKIKEVNIEAYKYLIGIPPRFWLRSRFTGQAMTDTLDNNISEAFNNVLIHARGKPIITMMEDIRVYLMKRWATNRTKVASMDFTICPKIKKRLQKECNLSRFWVPRHTSSVGNKFTLDLDTKKCSCRKWMISAIPCCHAIATMNYSNVDPENFIPTLFTRSTYEEVYASIIFPLNGHLLWETTNFNDVLPPVMRKMPGRPKKKGGWKHGS
ncbi:uncharacterized protein LOC108334790 [Vigna angularis]|uniref:uncharacterized protein LOC108334790 n=1 Tax=Phaseolus angularis TaxID=3914 RepID=UPI00080A1F9A|nr:uncharacterized protein LOC108334790 [Vigna angularis]